MAGASNSTILLRICNDNYKLYPNLFNPHKLVET